MKKRVAIYCGSNAGKDPAYKEQAAALGAALADAGIGIVYGGSKVGLMGAVADAALARGGEVIGVLPTFLQMREIAHEGLTDLVLVDSMHERKALFVEMVDAFIALPGGPGTLEEYFEVFTWAQVGLHEKPVYLYNVNGYYDLLQGHFEKMFAEGFIRESQRALLRVERAAPALLASLAGL